MSQDRPYDAALTALEAARACFVGIPEQYEGREHLGQSLIQTRKLVERIHEIHEKCRMVQGGGATPALGRRA